MQIPANKKGHSPKIYLWASTLVISTKALVETLADMKPWRLETSTDCKNVVLEHQNEQTAKSLSPEPQKNQSRLIPNQYFYEGETKRKSWPKAIVARGWKEKKQSRTRPDDEIPKEQATSKQVPTSVDKCADAAATP